MIVKRRKWMSVLFVALLILASSVEVLATTIETKPQISIQPYWKNTSDVVIILSIKDGKAETTFSIDGYKGVDKITAVAILERLNDDGTYTKVEKWDNISADNQWLDWTSTRYVAKGYTYRFTVTATVYKNGVGETLTFDKKETS